MQSRRDFLKLLTLMTGASGLIPESVQRAYGIEPDPGSTYRDAEHIVILMQENRSFDHAFGTLRGVRGFNDPRAMRLANGNSVFVQTDAVGNSYAPWRLDIRDTRITWMGSLPHSRESQVDAWNGGFHDGWLDAKRSGEADFAHLPLTMGYYTREDLPFYYALADAFTICDQNYCSVMTSTSPNRCYFWTGTIREQQRADAKAHIRNEQIDDGGLTWKTFPERLQEAGIRWKSYQNELTRSELSGEEDSWLGNFGDNVLECFAAYNVEAYPGFIPAAKRLIADLSAQAEKLESRLPASKDSAEETKLRTELKAVHKEIESVRAVMADAGETRYNRLSDQQKALHHAAFVTNTADPHFHALDELSFEFGGQARTIPVPKGDVLYEFRKDVSEGKLPTVSWLTASERFSDHPSSPWFGAWFISEVLDILTKNPEVWKKTIFIVTYDENDGYFDHAPSFVAADPKLPETGGASAGVDTGLEYNYKEDELRMGVNEKTARSGPIGMGFRVPMIIASPWSRGGWVNSQVFDHTSTLMFLERFVQEKYGKTVREENISTWRRTVAGDLTSIFRPYDAKGPQVDPVNRDKFVVDIARARYQEVPSNFTKLTNEQIDKINRRLHDSTLMPRQEEGSRPSCALPYELCADCNLSADGKQCEVRLRAGDRAHATQSAGAPFNVYLRNLEAKSAHGNGTRAATYAVKAGDVLPILYPLELFTNGRYDIEVYGPNGFYRMYSGGHGSSGVEARAEYDYDGSGSLRLHLKNRSPQAASIAIHDNAYNAKTLSQSLEPDAETEVKLPLAQSHGWYDFTVTTAEAENTIRFAGHVETGQSSMSDPAIG